MTSEQKTSYITVGVILAVIMAVAIFTVWKVQSQSVQTNALGGVHTTVAPLFAGVYTDLEGNVIDLNMYEDRVRVVNAWATWCPFCTNELPDFIELSKQYDPEDVIVIAINRKEPATTVLSYLRSIGITDYGNVLFLQDSEDAFYQSIGGFTMPETILYNADDTIEQHKRGFMTLEQMKLFIEQARTN